MKPNNIYILFISLMLFISACEVEIDIAIPDRQRKIVVNSLFEAETALSVNLTKSLSILDGANVVYLNDASITLYENNTELETLQYTDFGNYISQSVLRSGNTYEISILRNNQIASAVSSIPDKVEIISIDSSTIRFFDMEYLQCLIEFEDDPDQDNYFMFSIDHLRYEIIEYSDDFGIVRYDTITFTDSYFESEDIIIDSWIYLENKNFILFDDSFISGKTYLLNIRINFDINNPYNIDMYLDSKESIIYFNLYSVSEAYFKYFKTYSLHKDAQDNPFSEPVQVYSNVENGLGVFAGFSFDSDSIALNSKHFK